MAGKSKSTVLDINDISITFGNFRAVKNVSTSVKENEVHFLIGPNGAGKTTVLDAVCGKNKLSGGNIVYHRGGVDYDLPKIKENKIVNLGVGRKFQAPSVFTGLTVFENMELAVVENRGLFSSIRSKLSKEEIERIEDQLNFVGLYDYRNDTPQLLSHGQKQWLEIAMLCVSKPRLMLLDEPVAGMGRRETERTAELIRIIQKDCSILIVEHDMKFVSEVATIVTVLHDGEVLCEGSMDEVQNNQQVIDVYLGRGGE